MAMRFAVLQGLRVLDFTRVLAGPFATRLLGDFGAQVIKVQTRGGAVGAEDNSKAFFSTWNRNKLSITLNLNHPEARALALELVGQCDVVVENFSPRVMANWSLTYRDFYHTKPNIIMVSMSGMGKTGPWKDYVAFAPTIHSLTGHTYLNSYSGNTPGGLGFAYGDIIAGLYCSLAVLSALAYRHRTGRGQFIDLSEYEAACTTLGPVLMAAATSVGAESVAEATGPGQSLPVSDPSSAYPHIHAAPYGCYPCQGQDRWCAIAILDEAQWQGLKHIMADPAWMAEERFCSPGRRKRHEAVLDRLLIQWTRQQQAEALADRLQRAGIPAGVVQTAADLAQDPHLKARQAFVDMVHPLLGAFPADRSPIRFMDRDAVGPWCPAPLLGEHNELVFKEILGLSEAQFNSFVAKGIIG